MLGRSRDGAVGAGPRPGVVLLVVLPVVLAVALAVVVAAGAVLDARAAAVARAAVGDTGPVLAGAELPGDGSAGPPTVVLSASAAAHPQSAAVRDLLQRWADARNRGDLVAYRAALAPDARVDAAAFTAAARTQRVGSVVVRRINPVAGDEWVVPLGFVTTQDPAVAPPDVRAPRLCWQVGAVVETVRGEPRLAESRPGSQLRTPC